MNKPLGWFSHSRDIEILILSEACSPGWYGEDCVEGCGHCSNGSVCNSLDGSCKSCDPGYIGSSCKQGKDFEIEGTKHYFHFVCNAQFPVLFSQQDLLLACITFL